MNFNIEKGINPVQIRPLEGSKYDEIPLAQMIVGDSIFIPIEFTTANSISNYMTNFKKRNNVNFTIRKCEGGCRIFKIENK